MSRHRKQRRRGHSSRTRVVGYYYTGKFCEVLAERILERARSAGVVTVYDTGRGRIVWFDGPPGPALRAVRSQVQAVVAGKVRCAHPWCYAPGE